MQVPPDALNRVGLRRIGWQEVEFDPMPPLVQVLAHGVAAMKGRIVAHDVNLAKAAQRRRKSSRCAKNNAALRRVPGGLTNRARDQFSVRPYLR